MADKVKGRSRSYDSSRRQARAAETRRVIVQAASELFIRQGYARTTLTEVAEAADVSVETIYATFRNKPTLLHRVWDITVGGDDEDVLLHERPEVQAIRAEPDLTQRLRLQATFSTKTAARIAPFQLMVQAAAGADPAAADMLEEMDRQRLAGLGVMAREAAATQQLAVSEDECRDVLWSTTDGTLWHRLVRQRGWSDERYAAWLGRLWVRLLVQPERLAVRGARGTGDDLTARPGG